MHIAAHLIRHAYIVFKYSLTINACLSEWSYCCNFLSRIFITLGCQIMELFAGVAILDEILVQ